MINKVTAGQTANSSYAADAQQKSKAEESRQSVRTDTIEISTDVNATTNQDGKKTEQIDIQALKQEAEKSTENLRRLVEMMLEKQGKYASVQNSDLDTETVEEAKAAIAEDGEYGIKAVSERIAKFAINIAGYPPVRLQEMRDAIEQGFAEAEKVFGGKLPDICYQTYNAIKDKLDDYEKSCAQRMKDEAQSAQQE